ncbi:uncharacterized protein LAESUDRAFT_732689 [Laetiporus sulphureus 93-53]|uniref:Uncharacterized protein n=1 Tax=Laetiporus sulphureus 93-53 TaxID=1314785 RepID=A0A165B0L6_9APHY|nr:uncharacterized protein LAESUDRAFT_732689 [Laetiporus sulphureus 93-53]KZT00004.1 hypothetical protein LAESUDRAFT_732689 [Laetiporus sulphureus 93-53]
MTLTARPAIKRRRLAGDQYPCTVNAVHEHTLHASPSEEVALISNAKSVMCASCHRGAYGKMSTLVQCARCKAPTCMICSRTCTACYPSIPPTPALTRSSTPSASPLPSPKRTALALNTSAANANLTVAPCSVFSSGQRRKLPALEMEEDWKPYPGCEDKSVKDESLSGCGRTVCRDCCYEDPHSGTTTCYDCYGHLQRTSVQAYDHTLNSH